MGSDVVNGREAWARMRKLGSFWEVWVANRSLWRLKEGWEWG